MIDWFALFWLGFVAFFAFWHGAWALRAYKTGIATVYARFEISRVEKPFEYWMIFAARIVGVIFAIGMFVMGLQFFGEVS